MVIAEELDLPVDKVQVTLAPARPELVWNQLTGGSNTTESTFTPIRVAAAIARKLLLEAAALELGYALTFLVVREGKVYAPDGSSIGFGDLATKAARSTTEAVQVDLKPKSGFRVIGTPQNRLDARDAVTGRKQFVLDLDVPDALPTMVCRPPTLNGSPKAVLNKAAVLAMPGVTDVAAVDTGVAVRAQTFGQCIDAVRALEVSWNPGSVEGSRTRPSSRSCTRPRSRWSCRRCPCWRRRSTRTSRSCSAAAQLSSRTARSPTCTRTTPRSGPA